MHSRRLLLAAGLWLAACDSSHAVVAPSHTGATNAPVAAPNSGGAADALACELLLAGSGDGAPWHAEQLAVGPAALAADLDAAAVDHLRSVGLGAGAGPRLVGGTAVAALASAPDAPPDRNGDGSNRDEALLEEQQRLAAYAGTVAPTGAAPPLLPWRVRSERLAAPLPTDGAPTWRTLDPGQHDVQLADVGAFVRVRALAARRLLAARHRNAFGATAENGLLGLFLLQQVLGAEAELFADLFTSGGPLGALGDPGTYDPRTAARWLPAAFEVELDPQQPAIVGYRARDAASDLAGLADVLRGAAEFTSLTTANAAFALPELFRGHPFRPPPRDPIPASISWSRDIRPLLVFRCGSCHLQQTNGGFSIASYASMRLGGNKTRAFHLTFVAPGDPAGSQLHRILTGPQAPFQRMPPGGVLPAAEIALVDAWITAGALEDPPAPPPRPQPGADLLRVSFADLVALHFDPATGALHHRREADAPSGLSEPVGTGRALLALAAASDAAPGLEFAGWTPASLLERTASAALGTLVDGNGRVADEWSLATTTAHGEADLQGQAALTAGLLAAAQRLPLAHPTQAAARAAAARLLTAYVDPASGWFVERAGEPPGTYTADELADLLAALRLAAAADVPGAADARAAFVRRLAPALAFAEWDGHGEVLGDGVPDTDHDGRPEPAAAGGPFGRLPLLATRLVVGPGGTAPTTPTWSTHVRPLLLTACGDCHGDGNEQGHYHLDTRTAAGTPGDSGGAFPLLVPGDPDASFLFRKLADRRPPLGAPMPLLRTPLDPAGKDLVRRWILAGASAR